MKTQELYLKTVFCCMACDGNIAPEEITLVKNLVAENTLFHGLDAETALNAYIVEINREGTAFLKKYLDELSQAALSDDEQLTIVNLAIQTIESDQRIEYTEIKFFKKIRARLPLSDEQILQQHPDKEDFLLPDIIESELPQWDNLAFSDISLQ